MPDLPDILPFQKRIDDLINSPISPLDLTPSGLGLNWGMTKEECFAILGEAITIQKGYLELPEYIIQKGPYPVQLIFNGDYDTLNQINSVLYHDELFREIAFEKYTLEQKVEFTRAHLDNYLRLQNHYNVIIGSYETIHNSIEKGLVPQRGVGIEINWKIDQELLKLSYDQSFPGGGISWILLDWRPFPPVCHFEKLEQTKLLPTDLLPSKFGISWNMSKQEVLEKIKAQIVELPSYMAAWYVAAIISHNGQPYKLELSFDYEYTKLLRLEVSIYESRSFWDGDWTYEEMNQIGNQISERYDIYVSYVGSILGLPIYSGKGGSYNFASEFGLAYNPGYISIWNNAESQMQIEFNKEDKELPYVITVACYPPNSDLESVLAKLKDPDFQPKQPDVTSEDVPYEDIPF